MDTLDPFREEARRSPRASFVERHPYLFLVKRPSVRNLPKSMSRASAAIGYLTTGLSVTPAQHGLLLDEAAFAEEWRVVPVRKREGNPFPERIGVGRAQNCDVVLRLPFVSKLHAHFEVNPNGIQLVDLKSVNRTLVNGQPLVPGEPKVVRVGDRITFGHLELELVDAARLYDIVKTEVPAG